MPDRAARSVRLVTRSTWRTDKPCATIFSASLRCVSSSVSPSRHRACPAESRRSATSCCKSGWQLQKSDGIRDGAAIFPGSPPDLFVTYVEFARHPLERHAKLNRIQILALNVLDQRDLEQPVVRDLLHHHRYFAHPGNSRGTPPALPRHKLKTVPLLPHHEWLNDPVLPDRVRQLAQRIRLKHSPRLHRIRIDLVDRGSIGFVRAETRSRPVRQSARASAAALRALYPMPCADVLVAWSRSRISLASCM